MVDYKLHEEANNHVRSDVPFLQNLIRASCRLFSCKFQIVINKTVAVGCNSWQHFSCMNT